jgi:hypothetical protein
MDGVSLKVSVKWVSGLTSLAPSAGKTDTSLKGWQDATDKTAMRAIDFVREKIRSEVVMSSGVYALQKY